MSDTVRVFLLTLSALFPLVDPFAGSPICFLVDHPVYSSGNAKISCLAGYPEQLGLMVSSPFVGAHGLNRFGMSLP